ncbi:hypothetical protein [Parasphingorhabdus sp.]|uniref:hypothetical protein n=1 Tax=Parasphingorhabdus sp. TaxID=2709688 RepID=UPI00300216B0
MMKKLNLYAAASAAFLMAAAPAGASQASGVTSGPARPTLPSREEYPDAGQAFGMVWHDESYGGAPALSFMVPETDNRLWTMGCEKLENGSVRIAHMILATPKEVVAEDQFGFTIRVDDKPSIGILARMLPAQIEGEDYPTPQFFLPNNHALFPALARGNRAFVNLNGNRFSIHLKGSGEALVGFLRACR